MRGRSSNRIAVTAITLFVLLAGAGGAVHAQSGAGDGFLFRSPKASLTVHGGYSQPIATGGVFHLATSELTLGRSDFGTGNIGADLAAAVAPRVEVVLGVSGARSTTVSEYREWLDNNDLPIEQTTSFRRLAVTGSVRYYLADRGRNIGSIAWIPTRLVPFVSLGGGYMQYRFEQVGDFVDSQTLAVFRDRLDVEAWRPVMQGGAGAQWSLSRRLNLTGELRYTHGSGPGDAHGGSFSGYQVNLSGVSTTIGLTLRL